MNIERKELAPFNEEITLTIHKDDFEKEFMDELRKYRQQASLKGFRKGKTPMSVIKRMFGKSLLGEIIQKKLEEGINNYLTENKINTLGQPIPSDDQKEKELDPSSLEDFTYKFEIGLSPEFEVQGLSKEDTFPKYVIKVPDEKIEEEMDRLRKRMGQYEEIEEGEIEAEDLIDLDAKELENGKVKPKGWDTYFSVSIDRLADDKLKSELIGKKKGYSVQVDLTNLEQNTDQKFINKHYLNLDEDEQKEIGNFFEGKVAKIRRMALAEMDEEFFKQAFGKDSVDNEEKARGEIEASYLDAYGKQADVLLFKDLQDHLLQKNTLELPEVFLKKWLLVSNPEVSTDQVDSEFGPFKENLRWNLIRNKLINKYNIDIGVEQIKDVFKAQITSYFGANVDQNAPFVVETIDRMMQNKEQVEKVYQDLLFDQLYESMEGEITIDPKPIDLAEFEKLLADEQNKNKVAELVGSEEE